MKKVKFETIIALFALLGVLLLFGTFALFNANIYITVGVVCVLLFFALIVGFIFARLDAHKKLWMSSLSAIACIIACGCLAAPAINVFAATTLTVQNGEVFDTTGMVVSAEADYGGDATVGTASVQAAVLSNGLISLTVDGQAGANAGSCSNEPVNTTITITITNSTALDKVLEIGVPADSGGFSSVLINESTPVSAYDLGPSESITIKCVASELDKACQVVFQNIQLFDKVDDITVSLNREFLFGDSVATVNGAGVYPAGTTVSITADDSEDPDYVFLYWKDSYGNIVSSEKSYQITNPRSNCTYTAVFGYPTVHLNIPSGCTLFSNITYSLNGETHSLTKGTLDEPLVIPKSSSLTFNVSNETGFVDWRVLIGNTEQTIAGTEYTCPLTEVEYIVVPYFGNAAAKIGSTMYATLEGALRNAQNGNLVVLLQDYCLLSDAKVDEGVTLLVPFDSAETLITTNMGSNLNEDDAAPAKTLYRKLTLAQGVTLDVMGSISVGSRAYKQMVGQVGPYGAIYMEKDSFIHVTSTGALYAWGYIFGGETGYGSIVVDKGGIVYENLMVMDYPGSASSTNEIFKAGYFPLRAYTIRNVEVPMTLHSGAKEYAFYCLWGNSVGTHYGTVLFVGDDSSAVFKLNSGATLEKAYVAGKQSMKFNGSFSINSMSVSIKVTLLTVNVKSSDTSGIPLPSGFLIEISNGTMTLGDNIILTEGTKVIVHENASVDTNGKNVFVLGNEEGGAVSATDVHGTQYTLVNSSAVMDINGTITVNGGFYSYGTVNITSSKGTGKVVIQQALSNVDLKIKTSKSTQSTYTNTPATLTNIDGTVVSVTKATTYTYVDGYWRCAIHSEDSGVVTVEPTCYQHGVRTYTCSVCAYARTEAIAATEAHVDDGNGHCTTEGCPYEFQTCAHANTTVLAAQEPTCTDFGLTEGLKCNDCDRVLTMQEEVPALGHNHVSEITTAPTCEGEGVETFACSRCDDAYTSAINALGHSFGEVEVVTPPTCTEIGESQTTCATCGTTKADFIVALGHDHSVACYSVESSWHKCSRCDDTTEEVARQYTVIFQSYADDVKVTLSGKYAYGATVTAPVLSSNCFDLAYNWLVVSEGVLNWEEVVNAGLIDLTTGDNTITVPGEISVTGVKSGAISMSVKYAEESASSGTLLTVYVMVNCDDGTQVTAVFPNESELVITGGKVDGINSYLFAIDLTAEQLLCQDKLTVSFGEAYKEFDKEIAALLFAYSNALNNSVELDGESAQAKELVAASLAYGAAVQEYFYENPNYIITESKPEVTATNAYNTLVFSGNATVNGNTPIASFKSAKVSFGLEYMIRYAYAISLPEGASATKVGVIITDADGLLDTTAKWDGTTGQWHATHGTDANDRNLSTFGVAATELSDHYATVYVEYTDAEGNACFAYSTTLKYGVTTYLNREIYKSTTAADYETNQKLWKYVNLLNSLLEIANLVEKSGSNV